MSHNDTSTRRPTALEESHILKIINVTVATGAVCLTFLLLAYFFFRLKRKDSNLQTTARPTSYFRKDLNNIRNVSNVIQRINKYFVVNRQIFNVSEEHVEKFNDQSHYEEIVRDFNLNKVDVNVKGENYTEEDLKKELQNQYTSLDNSSRGGKRVIVYLEGYGTLSN
ncbi:unnamed protein product [Lymnaea stagnalis]|uniref:Uncharacterized protein n=1 Tax=Lymnaea stagnalis TaxID=6523 RepID=A0AAV2I6J3_LYMST